MRGETLTKRSHDIMNFFKRGFKAAKSALFGVRHFILSLIPPRFAWHENKQDVRHHTSSPVQLTLSHTHTPPLFDSTQDGGGDSDSDDSYGGDRGKRGFSHKKEVVVERTKVPVVQYAVSMYGGQPMGGIQGLWWYAKSLLCDDDGDVANQFIVEPRSGGSGASGGQGQGDEGDARTSEEKDVTIRYSHALVEVKGVSKGEVLLMPRNLD